MKDAGETGRKRAGRRCRPWMAATATVAHYPIHPRRPRQGLRGLLGEVIRGMIRGDRRSADGELPVEARRPCRAHLERDFRKGVDRGGPAEPIGRAGLKVVGEPFALRAEFGAGRIDRAGLRCGSEPGAVDLDEASEAGRGCADAEAATFRARGFVTQLIFLKELVAI